MHSPTSYTTLMNSTFRVRVLCCDLDWNKYLKNWNKHCSILPSKHCIVGPMLARCSCQHLLTSAQCGSQCWGDAVLHQSPAFSQHWHSAAGRHRNLRRPNNGGIMFPTSARSWQTAANQHRNCSYPTSDCKLQRTTSDPASRQQWRNNVANVGEVVKLQLAYIGTCVAPTAAELCCQRWPRVAKLQLANIGSCVALYVVELHPTSW